MNFLRALKYLDLASQFAAAIEAVKGLPTNLTQQIPTIRTRLFGRLARLEIKLTFEN